MQIVINFSDIDLNDWIDFDDEGQDTPELKDVFKSEILDAFVRKLNADLEVSRYVREKIDKELAVKIAPYRDDVAIRTIVGKIIERRIANCGSFFFLDQYVDRVEKEVDKYLDTYKRKMEAAVFSTVRNATESIINEIYANSAMRQFIDIEKLTSYVLQKMPEGDK